MSNARVGVGVRETDGVALPVLCQRRQHEDERQLTSSSFLISLIVESFRCGSRERCTETLEKEMGFGGLEIISSII